MINNSTPRLFLVFCLLVLVTSDVDKEPLCLSRYDWDYKMMQTTVTLEQEQNKLKQLVDEQSEVIRKQSELITEINKALKDHVHRHQDTPATGAAFVRWGKTTCPGNGTSTIYSGYMGGSRYTDSGAAVNYLCLPVDPLWDKFDDSGNSATFVVGAEYEIFGTYSEKLFDTALGNHDIPCAVCYSERSTTLMIPGRNACYDGWTMEYAGYLAAGHFSQTAATEYICLDKDPEIIPGSKADTNGKLIYMVEAKCSSLKCPPYVEGRELTCVVCTR